MTLRKFSISKHFRAWVFRLEKIVSIVLCKKKKIKIREAVKILLGSQHFGEGHPMRVCVDLLSGQLNGAVITASTNPPRKQRPRMWLRC